MAETRTTSSTGGEKGVKPQRHSLIPREGLDTIAEVFGFGAEKYADHNWRKGYEWSKSYDALIRHLTAWWSGEDLDPESGLSHLGHAGFHIMALATWQRTGSYDHFDDRYRPASVELPEPATYGEALEREIAEWAEEVRSGGAYDEEAWGVRAAHDNVRAYGADSPYPCEGMPREVWEARQAQRARESQAAARRAALVMDGLEPEEPLPPGSVVERGDVLGEGRLVDWFGDVFDRAFPPSGDPSVFARPEARVKDHPAVSSPLETADLAPFLEAVDKAVEDHARMAAIGLDLLRKHRPMPTRWDRG